MKILLLLSLSILLLLGCNSGRSNGNMIPKGKLQTRKGIEVLDKAIRSFPKNYRYFVQRAELHFALSELEKAIEDITAALRLNTSDPRIFTVQGKIFFAQKKFTQATTAALRAEALSNDSRDNNLLLANLYQNVNKLGQASNYVNKVLSIAPYEGEAYFYKGIIAAKRGDTLTAVQNYLEAKRLKPRFLDTYKQLSRVHVQIRDYDNAQLFAKEGLALFPLNSELHFNSGLVYQRTLQSDSAMSSYKKAIQLDPTNSDANFNLGILYFKRNELIPSQEAFQNALKYNSKYPNANFYTGQCFEFLGNNEKALAFYEAELKVVPYHSKASLGRTRIKKRLALFSIDYLPSVSTEHTETTPDSLQ